ncbi:MAG: hypothetical protein KKF30_10465 [Proteobacteria bacterium]|nr:hypothetical protein [Pseudomonadota bacterium]MCG2752728.1 hypothetical protein [Desulfobacteraceae bacterium]
MGILDHVQLINMGFTAGAGLIGIGVGIGVFRNTIKQIKEEIVSVKAKQSMLRGEDSGLAAPIYMPRSWCELERTRCGLNSSVKMEKVCDDLIAHTESIRALDNFARWWMQKEGLKIEEINAILGK